MVSTLKPMFSEFPNSMKPNAMLCDCNGSGKSNIAVCELRYNYFHFGVTMLDFLLPVWS